MSAHSARATVNNDNITAKVNAVKTHNDVAATNTSKCPRANEYVATQNQKEARGTSACGVDGGEGHVKPYLDRTGRVAFALSSSAFPSERRRYACACCTTFSGIRSGNVLPAWSTMIYIYIYTY